MKLMNITLLTLLCGTALHGFYFTENNYLYKYQDIVNFGNYDYYSNETISQLQNFLAEKAENSKFRYSYAGQLNKLNKAVRNNRIKKTVKYGLGIATACGLGYLGYQAYNNQDAIKDSYNNFTNEVSNNGFFNVVTAFANKATKMVTSYVGNIFGNFFGSKPAVNQEAMNNDIANHDNEQYVDYGEIQEASTDVDNNVDNNQEQNDCENSNCKLEPHEHAYNDLGEYPRGYDPESHDRGSDDDAYKASK